MKLTSVVSNLVGRTILRDDAFAHRWPLTFKTDPRTGTWCAGVMAVWVEDGHARALLADPYGTMAEVWLSEVKLLPEDAS